MRCLLESDPCKGIKLEEVYSGGKSIIYTGFAPAEDDDRVPESLKRMVVASLWRLAFDAMFKFILGDPFELEDF